MINPAYVNKLKEFCTTDEEIAQGLFFGFLVTYREDFPILEEWFLDGKNSVFPYDRFQIYAINLCRKNLETDVNELKIPLFGAKEEDEYEILLNILTDLNINSKGHVNNPLKFSIFNPEEDRKSLHYLKTFVGDEFDLEILAQVVSDYYETTEYAQSLYKYLKNNALMDYKQNLM